MAQSQFLKVAVAAAKKAEKVIMKHYFDEIKADIKADQTPVTVADTEAEKIIIQTIKNSFPDHGFLGEESGYEHFGGRNNNTNNNTDNSFNPKSKIQNPKSNNPPSALRPPPSEYLWIIDPIDGTKNYIKKIPIFATQIALMRDGELILGVSNAPALKELMYAEKGAGAFLNDRPMQVSQVNQISEAMMCHGGLKYFTEKGLLSNICKLINNSDRARGFGDFYMYHLVASGRADVAIEAAIKIWDIAALTVIVKEAGGVVTDIQGHFVDKNISSIMATNKELHNSVLRYFL